LVVEPLDSGWTEKIWQEAQHVAAMIKEREAEELAACPVVD